MAKDKNKDIPVDVLFATLLRDYKKLKVELGEKKSYIDELHYEQKTLKEKFENYKKQTSKEIRNLNRKVKEEHEKFIKQKSLYNTLRANIRA